MSTDKPWGSAERVVSLGDAEFREMADAAPVLIWVADVENRGIWFNRPWLEFTGRTLEEECGDGWLDRVCLDDMDALEVCVEGLRTCSPFQTEFRMLRYDGEWRWMLDTGMPRFTAEGQFRGFIGSCVDVTDRHNADTEIRRRETQLRLITDAIPGLVSYIDKDQRYRFINKPYEEWFGLSREEVLSRKLDEIVGRRAYAEVAPYVVRALNGERVTIELRIPYRQAGKRDVQIDYVPHRSDGKVVGYFSLVQDITERKRSEEQLRHLNQELEMRVANRTAELEMALAQLTIEAKEREAAEEQLRQVQKLDALGQLTGGIAHDFNNLLTPIVGTLDLLRRRVGEDEKAIRLISIAAEGAERASTLTKRLLTFARKQKLEPEFVGVGEVLMGMEQLIIHSIGPHISVKMEIPSLSRAAFIDPNQFELAVLNLAVNARDAMPEGGLLTISVNERTLPPENSLSVSAGPYLCVAVSDTGVGMAPDVYRKATEPFFSTKGLGKGSGLGLSMVHGLMVQSGGALEIFSSPGRGTTVEMWLPAQEDVAVRDQRAVDVTHVHSGLSKKLRLLLVDDEDLVRAGTVAMLQDLGHEVIDTCSGSAAVEFLRGGIEIDALITDHLMPGLTGAELIDQARCLRPELPVVMITGYAELPETSAEFSLLSKPFSQGELQGLLETITHEPDLGEQPV